MDRRLEELSFMDTCFLESKDLTVNLYNQALYEWRDAENMSLAKREEILSKLMGLWGRIRFLHGIAPGPDPRGEAPSHDYYYSCDTLSWVPFTPLPSLPWAPLPWE